MCHLEERHVTNNMKETIVCMPFNSNIPQNWYLISGNKDNSIEKKPSGLMRRSNVI